MTAPKLEDIVVNELTCLVCEMRNSSQIVGLELDHEGQIFRYSYQFCGSCGVVFLSERAPENTYVADLGQEANDQKYEDLFDKLVKSKSPTDSGRADWIAEELTRLGIDPSAQKVLDIGAQTGNVLKLLRDRTQSSVMGVDPQRQLAQLAKEKLDVEIKTGYFDSSTFPTDVKFSVVTFFSTFGTIPTPMTTLQDVYNVLEEGGLLLIETPDAWHVQQRHLHARDSCRYSILSLAQMLYYSGFDIVNWDYYAEGGVHTYDYLRIVSRKLPTIPRYSQYICSDKYERVKATHEHALRSSYPYREAGVTTSLRRVAATSPAVRSSAKWLIRKAAWLKNKVSNAVYSLRHGRKRDRSHALLEELYASNTITLPQFIALQGVRNRGAILQLVNKSRFYSWSVRQLRDAAGRELIQFEENQREVTALWDTMKKAQAFSGNP